MRRSYQKLLHSINTQSPLLRLAGGSASSEEFRNDVIGLFSPFFLNKAVLEQFASPLLVPDAIVLSRLSLDTWAYGMISRVLADHRGAAVSDETTCFMGYGTWEPDILHGLSHYWSAFELENDKRDGMPLEEFAHEVARNVAVVIEACLKPMLKELLLMVRIRKAKPNPLHGLLSMDLGAVVGELIDTCSYPELLAPPPWGLRLNQWRNICQHFALRVEGANVIGQYGKAPNQREITLSRSGLLEAAMKCVRVFEIIKLARTVAILDNYEGIKPHLPDKALRPEQGILALATAVATEGFEVRDLLLEAQSALLVVQDLTDRPPEERRLRASQFIYPLWMLFPKDSLTVDFHDRKGNLRLRTTARAADCEAVAMGRIPFSELAKRVTFSPHNR